MNARFMSNFPSQRTKRSSLNECSQRKSVLRVTAAAMIRLSRSQSPFRESRSMNYEYKARSYGDAGTSSSGRRVKRTTTASRRADFNGVVALTATEFARVRMHGEPREPDGSEPPGGVELLRKLAEDCPNSHLYLFAVHHTPDRRPFEHPVLECRVVLELSHRELAANTPRVEDEAIGIEHGVAEHIRLKNSRPFRR